MNVRTLSAFLFVLALLAFLNCQNLVKDDIFEKTVVKDHDLIKKNGITAITEYDVSKGKEVREKSIYNENGDLVEYTSYGVPGTYTEIKNKTYDNAHRVTQCITYWQDKGKEKDSVAKFNKKETWKYDSQGNISEYIFYNKENSTEGFKTTYTYDSKNRLAEEYHWYAEQFEGHHKFTYTYEEKDGKLSKLTKNRIDLTAETVNGKADLSKLKTGQPVLQQVTIYTYDKDGKLHSESLTSFETDGTTTGWYYTYDASGNIIQKTITGTKKFKCPDDYYEYDANGKMIKTHGTCSKKIRVCKYDALGLLAEEGYVSVMPKKGADDYTPSILYEITKK